MEFDLKPKYVTFNLFEAFKIIKQALTKELIDLLDEYGLKNKIIAFCYKWWFKFEQDDKCSQVCNQMWRPRFEK